MTPTRRLRPSGRDQTHSRWLYDDAGRLAESNSWFNDGPIDRVVYSYDEAGRHVRTVQLSHDGTQTDSEICSYDTSGKKTKVRFLGLRGANTAYRIEGTEQAYGAPGATMMTTTYDERDLPTKVVFQDANHNLLTYVTFVRDSAGRLLNEEMHVGAESLFPDLLETVPPEGREGMAAMLKKAFGEKAQRMCTIPGAGFSNARIEWAALVKTARPIIEINMRRAARQPEFAFPADAREPVILDDERRAFDQRRAIAHNEPRAFK